jgi:CRP/FNR family transcriptional regulator, cyclic AMP receptor protein
MKKILLIEDNQPIRENTAEILELANYSVITADNGKTGVELALSENPDLIICDIMMPIMDGYGVLHVLQKNPHFPRTPFIFLTAKAEKSEMRKGMDMGADDYLSKPFEPSELLSAVESRLKKAALIKQELADGAAGVLELLQANRGGSLTELIEGRDIHRFRKKQIIYQEGNRPSRLFYIEKGKVKAYKTNENGKELIVGLFSEGDFLGHVALLEGGNYKDTAEALEDVELAVIPRKDFEELINTSHEVSSKFIGLLAKNVSDMEDQLLRIAYNSLRKKVADSLIKLHKKYKSDINISRENLATVAGTATESLIRTLSDFRNESLIEIREGGIVILNEKQLESLIN